MDMIGKISDRLHQIGSILEASAEKEAIELTRENAKYQFPVPVSEWVLNEDEYIVSRHAYSQAIIHISNMLLHKEPLADVDEWLASTKKHFGSLYDYHTDDDWMLDAAREELL